MAATNSIPKELGDFEILRELGRGGMGVVYEARQNSLNRRVALKVLASSLGLTAKAVMRFKREAEAAARLHHTNIVPIYFTGEHEGVYFYAMELIDGPSLDQVIRHMQAGGEFETSQDVVDETVDVSSEPIPGWVDETIAYERPKGASSSTASSTPKDTTSGSSVATGAKYFDQITTMIADVANALQHAHDHGVISRDIKPGNLLLGSDGRLSVSDFGLARVLEQPGMTMSGEFVGTPRYMSPEQISAGRAPLDHRTDIYSLGATLYELVTLQPPFTGQSRDEVIGQILHKEPKAPRAVNRSIPKDLETICLKAMERDPDRRYQQAAEMAKDLRAFVNRFAISAKRVGLAEKTKRWVIRNPALALSFVAIVVACSIAAGFANKSHLQQIEAESQSLERAKEKALAAVWNGDWETASEEAAVVVESEGRSTWTLMLRGQLAHFRGNSTEEIRQLEEAVKYEPSNVTALAMLSEAYARAGQWTRHEKTLEELLPLPPESTEDLAFKAAAISTIDADLATDLLSKAESDRPWSGVVRVLKAHVLQAQATYNHDEELAAEGIEVINLACRILGDNVVAHRERLRAYRVAAKLWSAEAQDPYPRISEVRTSVELLESYPDYIAGQTERARYYELIGEDDAAFDCWQQAINSGGKGWVVSNLAALCFRRGDFDTALATFNHVESPRGVLAEVARAYVLSAEAKETRSEELDELCRQLRQMETGRITGLWARATLCYLGRTEDESLQNDLDRFTASENSRDRCVGFFAKGLLALRDGKTTLARSHFLESERAGLGIFTAARWSRAFLDQLDPETR